MASTEKTLLKPVTIHFVPADLEYLETVAGADGSNLSVIIRGIVRRRVDELRAEAAGGAA